MNDNSGNGRGRVSGEGKGRSVGNSVASWHYLKLTQITQFCFSQWRKVRNLL